MTRSLLLLAAFAVVFSLLNVAALTYIAADLNAVKADLDAAKTRIAQLEEDLYDEPCEPAACAEWNAAYGADYGKGDAR